MLTKFEKNKNLRIWYRSGGSLAPLWI